MQNSSERMREDMTSLNQQTEALQSQARVPRYPGYPGWTLVLWSTQCKCEFHLVGFGWDTKTSNEHDLPFQYGRWNWSRYDVRMTFLVHQWLWGWNHLEYFWAPKNQQTKSFKYKILVISLFFQKPSTIAIAQQVAERSEQLRGETDQLAQELWVDRF